jgi:hypothetical protein
LIMKITQFDTPGNNGDLAGNAALAKAWSDQLSGYFDEGVSHINAAIAGSGGVPQFYNPITNGSTAPDVGGSAGAITWNGFPRKFLGSGPGVPIDFAGAEPAIGAGQSRPQDEYLEWQVIRSGGKIASVQFTCEGFDYYQFLGDNAPDILLQLYQTFISPSVVLADLMPGGSYNTLNKWNTSEGAMHLTEQANNLFAEVILGAEATVRRKNAAGVEIGQAIPLTRCSQFGDPSRNSDPNIGIGVNGFARQGRIITLADPVGLYIDTLDDSSFRLPDGSPTNGWFTRVRGSAGHTLRAVFGPPAGSPFTVSDVKIGGVPVTFGGQIAVHITMKLVGVASVSTSVHNAPVPCVGAGPVAIHAAAAAAVTSGRRAWPPLRGAI